jgi:hypothetical protein
VSRKLGPPQYRPGFPDRFGSLQDSRAFSQQFFARYNAVYNSAMEAFAGIDVAFAKGKRLPVCLCVWNDRRLTPLPLAARDVPAPPRGHGNVASVDSSTVSGFADATALYLRLLEKHFGGGSATPEEILSSRPL